jgi:hypothetical protein
MKSKVQYTPVAVGTILSVVALLVLSLAVTPPTLVAALGNYRRWIAVWSRTDEPLASYPLEITSQGGNGFDHAALVSAGKSRADGHDLRVVVDSVEVDRWITGTNSLNCKVWINIDLALPVTTTLVVAFGSGDSVTSLTVADTGGFPSSGTLYNVDSGEAFHYQSKGPTHFGGITRASKGTSATAGTVGDTLVYIEHDVYLYYGEPSAGDPAPDEDYAPSFTLDGSNNVYWYYLDLFGYPEGTRSGGWDFTIVQGSATPACSNAAPSGYWCAGVSAERDDIGRFYVHNPSGITRANFLTGDSSRDNMATATQAIQSSSDGSGWTDEYSIPSGPQGQHTPWFRDETLTAGSRYVGLYLHTTSTYPGDPVAGVNTTETGIYLDFAHIPGIGLATEQDLTPTDTPTDTPTPTDIPTPGTPFDPGPYPYRRWIAIWNRTNETLANYPLEMTSQDGNGFDHAALVSDTKSRADGYDLRVVVDNVEADRWTAGTNSSNCQVWSHISLLPPVTTTLALAFGSGDALASLIVADTSGFPSSGTLYHPGTGEAFTYQAKDPTHFAGVTRAANGTPPGPGSYGDVLIRIEHDVYLYYGDLTAGNPAPDPALQPAFEMSSSANTLWHYADQFGNAAKTMSASWQYADVEGWARQYTKGQDPDTPIDPWQVAGIEALDSGSGRISLHNPCGIAQVDFAGQHFNLSSPTLTHTVQSSIDGTLWLDEYLIPPPSSYETWEGWARNETLTAGARYLGLYLTSAGDESSAIETHEVFVYLGSSIPGIAMSTEEAVSHPPTETPTSTPANTLTSTPTDTPTSTPTHTPVPPTITWTPSATPTPKGERLPTPDPSHTPEPTHIYNPDSDADHLPDTYECPLMPCRDTDVDGVPDYLDSDSDGDGISDLVEGDGDPDPDGIPNYRDLDSDDDTIPDYIESFGDTDGDGIPNFIDTDSDADGLSDEAEGVGDIDGDDIPNFLDNNANDGPSADADGDGILNGTEDTDDGDGDGNPDPDRDGDGIKNKADTDSDDDGIHDIIEGQEDPDSDGIPNYLDLDSDGDGLLDEDEGVPDYLIPNSRAFLPLVLDEDGTGRATHDLVDAPDQCVAGQVVQLGHSYRDDFDWLTGAPAWYYDKDWYIFGGVAGQTYVLETSDLGARADTVLQLYGPSCETLLAESDDVVPNEDKRSRLVWVAPADGTYHVLITQWDYVTHGVETHYTFSVSTGDGSDTISRPPKPFPPKPSRPSPPAVGASSSRTPAGAANQTEAAPSMLLLAALSAPAATFALTRRDAGPRRESLAALGS